MYCRLNRWLYILTFLIEEAIHIQHVHCLISFCSAIAYTTKGATIRYPDGAWSFLLMNNFVLKSDEINYSCSNMLENKYLLPRNYKINNAAKVPDCTRMFSQKTCSLNIYLASLGYAMLKFYLEEKLPQFIMV